jgi:hypothetical protein
MARKVKGERSSVKSANGRPLNGGLRIGDILVRMGVLSDVERDEILVAQHSHARPFGVLAEEMFGVSAASVERAWAAQFAHLAPRITAMDLVIPQSVMTAVTRRQAWQFRVLPLDFVDRELVVATTEECLPRAMRFMAWRVETPVSFVLAEPLDLGEALCRAHPMSGMRAGDVAMSK